LDNHRIIVQFSAGARDFFFSKASIPALGPIQRPIQWVAGGALSQGLRWPGCEVDHTPPANAKFGNE
jgi:hypothetical protein